VESGGAGRIRDVVAQVALDCAVVPRVVDDEALGSWLSTDAIVMLWRPPPDV
jgi:hypothetical protein